jgi:hypothetical protein
LYTHIFKKLKLIKLYLFTKTVKMKKFTKFLLMMAFIMSSSILFSQLAVDPNYVESVDVISVEEVMDVEKGPIVMYDPADYPPPERQGGEDIGSALVISSLPFYDVGTTVGYTNNYDEACPYTGSTSPDVVFSYTPTVTTWLTIDLCASGYDTKVYVYEDSPGTLVACNDDACPGFRSYLEDVQIDPGHTYYIVVDGYGGDAGTYDLYITGIEEPANNTCATAEMVTGPYPISVSGSTNYASVDCLGYQTVWYEVDLPYTDNILSVDFCGSDDVTTGIGTWAFMDCADCPGTPVIRDSFIFRDCGSGSGYNEPIVYYNVAGPTTIFVPVYALNGFDFNIEFMVTGLGELNGHVFNGDGLAIAGATVTIPTGSTTTDGTGYYEFTAIQAATYDVTAEKPGYNPQTVSVNVGLAPPATVQDFVLTKPNFTVSPLIFDETLHPNEYLTRYLGLLNTGDGPVYWTATIGEGTWLSYGDGPYVAGIGLTDMSPITGAIGFDPVDLASYDGLAFTMFRFRVGNCTLGSIVVQIWENNVLILEEPVVAPVANAWNEVEYSSPVIIDATNSYKIGYTVSGWNWNPDGAIGCQDYVGDLNSDWAYLGGWDHLSFYLP